MNRPEKCLLIDGSQEIFRIALNRIAPEVNRAIAFNGISVPEQRHGNSGGFQTFIFSDINAPGTTGKQSLVAVHNKPFLNKVPLPWYATISVPGEPGKAITPCDSDFIATPPGIKQLAENLNDFFNTISSLC
ncbi:MAG TPA: hypothetical protein PL029_05170 [Bacteroidia bacterium]|nr:hypothetical protein [Bacteroidia bacterium]